MFFPLPYIFHFNIGNWFVIGSGRPAVNPVSFCSSGEHGAIGLNDGHGVAAKEAGARYRMLERIDAMPRANKSGVGRAVIMDWEYVRS